MQTAMPGEWIRLQAKRNAAGKARRVYVRRPVSRQLKSKGLGKHMNIVTMISLGAAGCGAIKKSATK